MSKICISLELLKLTADDREMLDSVHERIAIAANEWVTIWHQWHRVHGSRELIAQWMQELRDWHRADKIARGDKPKLPVSFSPPELIDELKVWAAAATTAHWKTNRRCLELLANWLRGKLTTSNGGLSEWIEVILNRRRSPQFLDGIPIPIDRKNAKLIISQNADGRSILRMEARIDRFDKVGSKMAGSTVLKCDLKAGGKSSAYARPAWDAAKAGGQIAGARLVYKEGCRKWFVALTVDAPVVEQKPLIDDRTAIVCPGWTQPFLFRVIGGDGSKRHGFRAEHIGHLRAKILAQRLSRQSFYRIGASSARKGRGRKRGIQAWEGKLSRYWMAITKLNNDVWSCDLVERLVKMQVGRVILMQPTDGRRFLETTGQTDGYEKSSGWDWTQWISMASRKLTREGIQVTVEKDSCDRNRIKRRNRKEVA